MALKRFFKNGLLALILGLTLSACSQKDSWIVTCPWAPSGVAAVVSQKTVTLSTNYADDLVLVAEAIKGDAATVNNWILEHKDTDPALVLAGEGLFSITANIEPQKLKFAYEDFVFIDNLYSAVFVLSSAKKLNLHSIKDLQSYVAKEPGSISVAVNGAISSEAFLATALFSSMGVQEKLKLTPYASAAEAAQAVSRGETLFAISHQTQILESKAQNLVDVIAAFDQESLKDGPLKGVEGVGAYGYPYFRNCCFILAKKGNDPQKIARIKELYKEILQDKGFNTWLKQTMHLEVDMMDEERAKEHLEHVSKIVKRYQKQIM